MTTKNASPKSGTGTPRNRDSGLVVTFSQLTTPVLVQARVTEVE